MGHAHRQWCNGTPAAASHCLQRWLAAAAAEACAPRLTAFDGWRWSQSESITAYRASCRSSAVNPLSVVETQLRGSNLTMRFFGIATNQALAIGKDLLLEECLTSAMH